jgi:hypothetical protein
MGKYIKNGISYSGGSSGNVTTTTDTTLTQLGVPADSKTVGDKINALYNNINNLTFLPISYSEYNALADKDDNTLYLVYDD